MAITTLDGVVAGFKPPVPIIKGPTPALTAVGALRGYTPWYNAGVPGASVAATIGVNGQACTPALDTPANVLRGRLPRTNPVSGNAHVGRLSMNANVAGQLWLIDRLWQNSGLSVTSTAAQAITPAAIPSRDRNGAALGDDVLAAMEWSVVGGAGTPTVTLTYTDESGNTGNSATLTGVATPAVGTFEIFTLAAGDTGIRAPTSFIQSATRSSGSMHLVLFRILAMLDVPLANAGAAIDALTGGLPRIYDDSILQLVWIPTATTALNFLGTYVETQG